MRTWMGGWFVVAVLGFVPNANTEAAEGWKGPENLIKDGGITSGDAWTPRHSRDRSSAALENDRSVGATSKGALLISASKDVRGGHSWSQRIEAPDGLPCRLKVTALIKTEGLSQTSAARVFVNCFKKKADGYDQVAFVNSTWIEEDTDWREVDAVFDVPADCQEIVVYAILLGTGKAWFDDLRLACTDEPVQKGMPAKSHEAESEYEKLARRAAEEIPWLFDAKEAKVRAEKEGKPILAYVRCTSDDRQGLASASESIRAEKIKFGDDGYRKDVLFRAGALSEPDVSALIVRRFVPLCLTYHFYSHGVGKGRPDWRPLNRDGLETAKFDNNVGARDKGSLCIAGQFGAWLQTPMISDGGGYPLDFSVKIKTEGGSAAVKIMCNTKEGQSTTYTDAVTGVTDWTEHKIKVDAPRDCRSIHVIPELKGGGKAWFDDFSLVRSDGKGEDLIANGAIELRRGEDPLAEFGLAATEVVTPALLVVDSSGRVLHKISRIGVASADLVDWWARTALKGGKTVSRAREPEELFLDGEIDKAISLLEAKKDTASRVLLSRALTRRGDLKRAEEALAGLRVAEAEIQAGVIEMRKGQWGKALPLFDAALGKKSAERIDAAKFWRGWCLRSMGRFNEAATAWREIVGETSFGKKAAACLVSGDIKMWLSESARLWPRTETLPDSTECGSPGAFDPVMSIQALVEFQLPDGSFADHRFGAYWAPSYAAFAAEAFDRWIPEIPAELQRSAAAARDRAVGFLVAWSKTPGSKRCGTFNDPYALMCLVRLGKKEAAQRVIRKIVGNQFADGNWSVYGPDRPTSFNTALAVMALVRARTAGLEMPEGVIEKGAVALEAMLQQDLFPYSTKIGHEWMTTNHGAIARDSLCEDAQTLAGCGSPGRLDGALGRFLEHHRELKAPTKHYYADFNPRGHGSYFFFFAHRHAIEAAERTRDAKLRQAVACAVREAVLSAMERDGTFLDHHMYGRAYGTAMALCILSKCEEVLDPDGDKNEGVK